MAVIKIIPSKWSIKKIIDYVLKKDKTIERITSGKDCLPENAAYTMNATKDIYGKTDGRSYYHIIQSFKPGELEPELAHDIGKELAEKEFKGFEVLISTHIDKEHIHNHFVLNSVSFIDGHKVVNDKEKLREIRRESNRICQRENLSIIKEPYAHNRYTMAEYKLAEKGLPIWKEQLRASIDEAKEHSRNVVEMSNYLEYNFNIKMKIQNKNLSFLHPDKQKYCRGKKLGNAYTKDEIMRYFERGPEEIKSEREAADKLKAANHGAVRKRKEDYERWKKDNPEEAAAAAKKRKEDYERWKKENPEAAKAAYEKWRKENPEEAKAAYERWKKDNPEEAAKIKAAYEEWRKAHPEEAKAAYEEWKEENPEDAAKRKAAYEKFRKSHPEEAKEACEKWKKESIEARSRRAAYESWEKSHPEEAKEVYEKWVKAHPEALKEAYEKWKKDYPKEAVERKVSYEKWKKAHPKEAKAAYEKWKEENPEEAKVSYERWEKSHPKELAKRIASYEEWWKAHPEEAKAAYESWLKENPEEAASAVKKIKEVYEKWEKDNPLEAKKAYEEWWKAHPEEAKASYEEWKEIYLEEERVASEKKYLEWKASHQPKIVLSKVGFGIEGITNKISRDIEKEKIRVDESKIHKDRAKEKYRRRDRIRETDRERER